MFHRIKNKLKREINSLFSKLLEDKISYTEHKNSNILYTETTEKYNFSNDRFTYIGKQPYWMDFKNIKLRPLFVKEMKEIEVLDRGVVVNREGQIELESTIFQLEYLNKLNCNHRIFFRSFFSPIRVENVIILSNYLDSNYFHWILESIGRLVLIDGTKLKKYKIVLNSNAPKFAIDSIVNLFGISPDNILLKNNMRLKVSNALLPSFPHTRNENTTWTNIYNPHVIQKINFLSKKKTSLLEFKRNFIISRRKATQRRILNEDAILDKFNNLNFELIYLEDLTFWEQMQLFRNAGIIIATHGAGLANLIFSENPFIIEFFPSNRNNRDAFYFYQICNELNFFHYIYEYKATNDGQDLLIDDSILNELFNILTEHNTVYAKWAKL